MEATQQSKSLHAQCIIHQPSINENTNYNLITPQNHESWLALLEAAQVRNHNPLLNIAKELHELEIPQIFYHRKCRSLFTMKRDLETLKRKADTAHHNEAGSSCSTAKRQHRSSSNESRVYNPDCIFCCKVKYLKRASTREKLIKATQLRVDQKLRDCAVSKGDENILAVTSRDIVAAEAQYHASCYKNYTRVTKKDQFQMGQEKHDNKTDEDELYKMIEEESYEELFQYMRTAIIPNKQIAVVSSLTAKLEYFMMARGVKAIKDSTKKHIRRKLKCELQDSIHILSDNNGRLLAVPDSVTLQDVVLENQCLKMELKEWKTKSSNFNKVIDQSSLSIRSAIREDKGSTPWPYHPTDVHCGYFTVPAHLERFFVGLLTGEPENTVMSQRIKTLVQSFSQDVIYAVTCGQKKSPKHWLLPYAVKTLTGNVELIRMLNRLGHGVSYSQLEENDTALCLQKLAACENQQIVLPSTIHPHVFTNLAWDNIDRLEETHSGKGTSHRVNGIAVQKKLYGPHLPKVALPLINKLKQRTVSTEHQELPIYVAGERVGPQPIITKATNLVETTNVVNVSRDKNLIWTLARHADRSTQTIPSWTGFNIKTRDLVNTSEDVIGYLPTINAPATEMTTVFEILNQSELIRKELQLKAIVVVLDQALFAKATEISWKYKDRYSKVILRMGTFHTICNVLSIIGKRFQDAGLGDICIETGIVAEGSLKGVLGGKMYNRSIRIHKYLYEALMRLAWAEFILWIDENQQKMSDINIYLDHVNIIVDNLCQQNFDSLLHSPDLIDLRNIWNDFLQHLRHGNGELSAFWMSYLDIMEDVLLGLLRASREGNWELHLTAIRAMIPWCFAYDKLNYARYLPFYYAQMTNLSQEHPDVHEAFQNGAFSVQISSSNPFGRIPVDQATEVTVNKDTQTPGGTAGFSLKSGAVKRYYITAEHRSAFLGHLRNMVQGNTNDIYHADLQTSRIQRDEEAVSTVVDILQSWINPFSENQNLVNISTAKEAPRDITNDLMNAKVIGEESYSTFKEERLEKSPPTKKFHDPLKMKKLKTFSNMCMKKKLKVSGRSVILKADRSLFGRIIVMAQGRNIHMMDILSHPLGPLPWALSTPDGLIRKTNKATLASCLQKNVSFADKLPEKSATVVDGMSLVQRVKGDQRTFGEVAKSILSMAMREGSQSQRIDVVFDTYQEVSIKNRERLLRGEETGHQLQSITASQIVRQWRKFLSYVNNKTSLITFLVNEWKKAEYTEKLKEKILFATVIDKCYRITSAGSEEVPALQCVQEEADGRLLLHALHAAEEGYRAILVSSDDTDVFIMCLAFHEKIGAPLFQKCGTRTRTHILDIRKIGATVGRDVCMALIGMHAYTGCDTVSAFAGKGKAGALKILINSKEVQATFMELGQKWDMSSELMDRLEAFTCLLYAPKSPTEKRVNDLRYHLFCVKKGEIESHQLPQCRDCLKKHAQRANYQAAIWRMCLKNDPKTPSPIGKGWKIEKEDGGDQLVVHWMEGEPAPEAVLDLLSCTCPKKCELPKCVCLSNGLRCTDMCKLLDCDNQTSNTDTEESDSEDDLEEENDY